MKPSPKKPESLSDYLVNRAAAMPEPDRSLLMRQAKLLSAATKHSGNRQGLGTAGALEVLWKIGSLWNSVDDAERLRK